MYSPDNDTQAKRPVIRSVLGAALTGLGLVVLAQGIGWIPVHSGSVEGSRTLVLSVGVLLMSTGVQVGMWISPGTRLADVVGATFMTAFAAMFGSVAFFGDARGFRATVGAAHTNSHGSVGAARIAFGIAAAIFGLIALWGWKRAILGRK